MGYTVNYRHKNQIKETYNLVSSEEKVQKNIDNMLFYILCS